MQTFRYSSTQLQLILDQAGIYMCACPAQLAAQMMELRTLHQYQMNCMSEMPDMADSHRTIADAVFRAHALLEEALDRVQAYFATRAPGNPSPETEPQRQQVRDFYYAGYNEARPG